MIYPYKDGDKVRITGITSKGKIENSYGRIGEICAWRINGLFLQNSAHRSRNKYYYTWELVCKKNILEQIKDNTKSLYLTKQ